MGEKFRWTGVWATMLGGRFSERNVGGRACRQNSPTKPPTKLAHQARLLKNSPTKPPTKLAH